MADDRAGHPSSNYPIPPPGVVRHPDGSVEMHVMMPGWLYDALAFASQVTDRSLSTLVFHALRSEALHTIHEAG